LIHRLFAEQFDIALRYEKREVAPGTLAEAVVEYRRLGVRGINITVPLKEEACRIATGHTSRARVAGAANVLTLDEPERLEADNTDGVGLVRDLLNHAIDVKGLRVLLLGAGGAARGVLPALLAAGTATVTVANRTASRAEALVTAFAALGALEAAAPDTRFAQPFDVILNATAAGLVTANGPTFSRTALAETTAVYDLVYGHLETPFLAWARACGVERRVDGLGMLVEQAAVAFERWHGCKPVTAPVIACLRTRL